MPICGSSPGHESGWVARAGVSPTGLLGRGTFADPSRGPVAAQRAKQCLAERHHPATFDLLQQQDAIDLGLELAALVIVVRMVGIPIRSRHEDRTSVVQGKSVSVRVDTGGRGIIKKKKT